MLTSPSWYKPAEHFLEANVLVLYLAGGALIALTVWFVFIQPIKLVAAAWVVYMFMP